MEWDDLRLVLAIARERGLAGAARVLRVNHSTVFRRLNAAEADLGVQLFERLPTGYQPTEAGSRLVGAAERIEAETLAVERELTGRDTRLSGRVRVTCSETLAYRLLTAELARFASELSSDQLPSEVRDVARGIEAGANVYVFKPTDPEALVQNVRMLLGPGT